MIILKSHYSQLLLFLQCSVTGTFTDELICVNAADESGRYRKNYWKLLIFLCIAG